MFETILIANRGEIACRVARSCRRLGLRTVAVYSDADREARFVREADDAVRLGPAPASESYLRADAIVEAAQRTGSDAIHPGYGFLAENAAFAEACERAGVRFIGPPASAMVAMGMKDAAKALMEKAGVPVVPGYHGQDQTLGTLAGHAERIGFPVLIKAVAGGGGKGMRRVDCRAELEAAIGAAQREAESAFGHARVLIEKYIQRPRHVEVQIFADAHGHVVHLFERDCSLQRRHQKVIEEAPAPGMHAAAREAMGQAAVRAAEAIGYQGAGTVEFIVDAARGLSSDSFYFMEMNTRLQVEHPVTELITGLDLVEWQIRVAEGRELPFRQQDIALCGHAFEARLYAEDPSRDYLPQTGRLLWLRLPEPSRHVRVDSGVEQGDTISVHYDPLIAKLVVWDEHRSAALRRMRRALEQVELAGLSTNLELLSRAFAHPQFVAGEVHTGFIADHALADKEAHEPLTVALVCAGLLVRREQASRTRQANATEHRADPYSPWASTHAFRLNEQATDRIRLRLGPQVVSVGVTFVDDAVVLELAERSFEVRRPELSSDSLSAEVNGARMCVRFVIDAERVFVVDRGRTLEAALQETLVDVDDEGGLGGAVHAPMPGKIIAVTVEQGQRVDKGVSLVCLEAMKMEHTLSATTQGTVRELKVRVGDQVEEGSILLVLEPDGQKREDHESSQSQPRTR